MALDKVIDSAKLEEDLTSVANAIREKTGSTDPIAFPDGFVEQVGAIQTGGGDDTWTYFVEQCMDNMLDYLFYSNAALTNEELEAFMSKINTSNIKRMNYMFYGCNALTTVPLFDTQSVTSINNMFCYCRSLTTVPLFDTRSVTDMNHMFSTCQSLTTVPLFDTRSVTNMNNMFYKCQSLTTVPLFDTRSVTYMSYTFNNCSKLTTVPSFDARSVMSMPNIFNNCQALTEIWLRNIKCNLQVGSGTSWGHLLTVDSLVHLCYELRDTGSSNTLTVGSANLEKLAAVYVRSIEITDEMRAEDDLIDEKLPFEVCESTDEGATLISEYVQLKNWIIK